MTEFSAFKRLVHNPRPLLFRQRKHRNQHTLVTKRKRGRQVLGMNRLARRRHVVGVVAANRQIGAVGMQLAQLLRKQSKHQRGVVGGATPYLELGRLLRKAGVERAVELARLHIREVAVLALPIAPDKADRDIAIVLVVRGLELATLGHLVRQPRHAILLKDLARFEHALRTINGRFERMILDLQRHIRRLALFLPALAREL